MRVQEVVIGEAAVQVGTHRENVALTVLGEIDNLADAVATGLAIMMMRENTEAAGDLYVEVVEKYICNDCCVHIYACLGCFILEMSVVCLWPISDYV